MGYSALELIKLLLRHPAAEIVAATSRQEGNLPIARVHPSLTGRLDLRLEDLGPAEAASRADCVFSCLPHGVTAGLVPQMLGGKCRVIDFSADYRLKDPAVYEQWYGEKHADPGRLAEAVYGLPELFRSQIQNAALIANPGCYPSSAILALAPLLKAGLIEPTGIIIDSKSGVSGAGRTPKLTTLFAECNENLSAYNVGEHRHTPEIEQVLSTAGRSAGRSDFHAASRADGPRDSKHRVFAAARMVSEKQALETLQEFYASEPFVKVVEHLPGTKDVSGTNYCHVTVRVVRDRVITISCLDNLIKGAAGAAVQNFNLMFGLSGNRRSVSNPKQRSDTLRHVFSDSPRLSSRRHSCRDQKQNAQARDTGADRIRAPRHGRGRLHAEPGLRRAGRAGSKPTPCSDDSHGGRQFGQRQRLYGRSGRSRRRREWPNLPRGPAVRDRSRRW